MVSYDIFDEEDLVETASLSTPPLSPVESQQLLSVLPYTPEGVAVPADAAGDASSVYICLSQRLCFARPSTLLEPME